MPHPQQFRDHFFLSEADQVNHVPVNRIKGGDGTDWIREPARFPKLDQVLLAVADEQLVNLEALNFMLVCLHKAF